uniref:Helicase C-terminal domain-containing protein n=1 Tax=Ditylenchus dipsaci TaxID=166011 RepID=A0A915DQ68_9BILA
MVINYDFPNSTEDYVNRIGRTARGNKKGESYTFFTSHDGFKNAQRLIQVLREANQEVPQSLEQLASGSFAPKAISLGSSQRLLLAAKLYSVNSILHQPAITPRYVYFSMYLAEQEPEKTHKQTVARDSFISVLMLR